MILIMMNIMIISPFGQLGLWASSSGVRDVFTVEFLWNKSVEVALWVVLRVRKSTVENRQVR
jgi:hypothetical protein